MQNLIVGMDMILPSWTNWQHDIRNKHQAEPAEMSIYIGKGVNLNVVCFCSTVCILALLVVVKDSNSATGSGNI